MNNPKSLDCRSNNRINAMHTRFRVLVASLFLSHPAFYADLRSDNSWSH